MMRQKLILVGCGGFGREVAAWIVASKMPFDILGHIDDIVDAPQVIGPITTHEPVADAVYLTCFGDGTDRRNVRTMLEKRGARFTTLIAPQVISATALGRAANNIFMGYCSVSNCVVMGDDVLIQSAAVIGHDIEIGDGVTISSHAFIGGFAKLGRLSTIHPHAVILPKVRIGEGAVVGAGSVVIKDVAPYTTVFGAPAKVIAYGKRDG